MFAALPEAVLALALLLVQVRCSADPHPHACSGPLGAHDGCADVNCAAVATGAGAGAGAGRTRRGELQLECELQQQQHALYHSDGGGATAPAPTALRGALGLAIDVWNLTAWRASGAGEEASSGLRGVAGGRKLSKRPAECARATWALEVARAALNPPY